MTKYAKVGVLIAGDIVCINLAYLLAYLLRFEFDVQGILHSEPFALYLDAIPLILMVKLTALALFGLYSSLWKYAGLEQIEKLFAASTISLIIIMAALNLTGGQIPRSVQGISYLLDILLLGGIRLSYRLLRNPGDRSRVLHLLSRVTSRSGKSCSRVLLVGGGDAGASLIKEIERNPSKCMQIVGVIDDNPEKLGKTIAGKRILAKHDEIPEIAKKLGVNEIFVAIPSATRKQLQAILTECNKTGSKIKTLPAYIDLIDGRVAISKLRDVAIEDLLGREPVSVDLREISGYLTGKVVLVTGGAGSIGSELCRQIAAFQPRELIAIDIHENSLFDLGNEMKRKYPYTRFRSLIGSVRNRRRLEEAFETYRPQVVFHAAAHKHVPLMEENPKEAILNNILGTNNIIEMADQYGAERFVLISTDKAVNPTNVMGATKRVGEMLMQEASGKSKTNFSAVRFGNVLGSNGSVLPLFRKQIEQGGPVTVTHEEVTRFFMTIPEAVQLVIQAGAMASGGEIFILDMGEPVKIMELAENVIRLSGYTPRVDIDIVVTGLRPGEKLYEELLLAEEGIRKTQHGSIHVGRPVPPSEELQGLMEQGREHLGNITETVCRMSDAEVKEWLMRLVPNYSADFSEQNAEESSLYK